MGFLTKFHDDSSKIVDFLLVVDFLSCLVFFESVSSYNKLIKFMQNQQNLDFFSGIGVCEEEKILKTLLATIDAFRMPKKPF